MRHRMMTPIFTHGFPPKLAPLLLMALVILPSCTTAEIPPAYETRPPINVRALPQSAATVPAPLPTRPVKSRPDPRYRAPLNLAELRAVAGEVEKATGRKINWKLKLGRDPGPLAIIRGGIDNCTIFIHPVAARKVPPNTWAFIFGHEFAHLVGSMGPHSQTNPAIELKADIAGARYAMAAGYRLEAFLGWVLTEPDQDTRSHGSLNQRVRSIAAHFGIPQNVIQAHAKRYSNSRTR